MATTTQKITNRREALYLFLRANRQGAYIAYTAGMPLLLWLATMDPGIVAAIALTERAARISGYVLSPVLMTMLSGTKWLRLLAFSDVLLAFTISFIWLSGSSPLLHLFPIFLFHLSAPQSNMVYEASTMALVDRKHPFAFAARTELLAGAGLAPLMAFGGGGAVAAVMTICALSNAAMVLWFLKEAGIIVDAATLHTKNRRFAAAGLLSVLKKDKSLFFLVAAGIILGNQHLLASNALPLLFSGLDERYVSFAVMGVVSARSIVGAAALFTMDTITSLSTIKKTVLLCLLSGAAMLAASGFLAGVTSACFSAAGISVAAAGFWIATVKSREIRMAKLVAMGEQRLVGWFVSVEAIGTLAGPAMLALFSGATAWLMGFMLTFGAAMWIVAMSASHILKNNNDAGGDAATI